MICFVICSTFTSFFELTTVFLVHTLVPGTPAQEIFVEQMGE